MERGRITGPERNPIFSHSSFSWVKGSRQNYENPGMLG